VAAWLLALAGTAALAVASADIGRLRREVAEQRDAADSAAALRLPRPHMTADLPARGILAPTESASAARTLRMARHVRYPWSDAFVSIELSTPEHLQWMGFQDEIDRPLARLEGIAPDVHLPLGVMATLGDHGWRQLSLVEVHPVRTGTPGIAFSIVGRFDASMPRAQAIGRARAASSTPGH
jgi:hypothetical protein